MKKLLVLLAGALLLAGCVNTSKSNVARKPLVFIQDAPEFQLKNAIDGDPINSKDFKGKVVVVDFWATWCVPCKTEIPEYNKLREKWKDRGVEFIGVTFESSVNDTKDFIKEFEMKYPVGMGNDLIDVALGGHQGLPTTFVVGKDWKVYRKILGSTKNKIEFIDKDIKELLAREQAALQKGN
jgi:thiol-disulfide isomerase/thioredoxin